MPVTYTAMKPEELMVLVLVTEYMGERLIPVFADHPDAEASSD
jgi:hypothetical protein